MTRNETAALLAVARAATGMPVDDHTVGVWTDMLGDLDARAAVQAMRDFLAEEARRPTIADIRKRVAARSTPPVDAGAAWGEVQRAISRVGRYRTPTWSSPAIAAVVDAIGWDVICSTDCDDVPTLRAQFERYLKGHVETRQRAANLGSLAEGDRRGQIDAGEAVLSLIPRGRS